MPKLTDIVLPPWARWAALVFAMLSCYGLGRLQEARVAGEKHADYLIAQATESTRIARAQEKVVVKTETVYRDRIQKIYVQGAEREKQIPVLVQRLDDERFGVNVGWVRAYNAAWQGGTAGPAEDSDRGPAGIPISEIARIEDANATAALAWREQALGCRAFYRDQQKAINEKFQGERP